MKGVTAVFLIDSLDFKILYSPYNAINKTSRKGRYLGRKKEGRVAVS